MFHFYGFAIQQQWTFSWMTAGALWSKLICANLTEKEKVSKESTRKLIHQRKWLCIHTIQMSLPRTATTTATLLLTLWNEIRGIWKTFCRHSDIWYIPKYSSSHLRLLYLQINCQKRTRFTCIGLLMGHIG